MENNELYLSELPRVSYVYVILPVYLYHRNAKIKFKIEAKKTYNPSSTYASYKLSDKEYLSDSDAIDSDDSKRLTYKEESNYYSHNIIFDDIYINSSINFVVILFHGQSL